MKNALLFDEKNQRVRGLTALNELAFALGSSRDLDSLLASALKEVVSVTRADTGSVLLTGSERRRMPPNRRGDSGYPDAIVETTRIPVGEGIAGWVADFAKNP